MNNQILFKDLLYLQIFLKIAYLQISSSSLPSITIILFKMYIFREIMLKIKIAENIYN